MLSKFIDKLKKDPIKILPIAIIIVALITLKSSTATTSLSTIPKLELPLNYTTTALTKEVGNWDTWHFTPTNGPTGQFNYVGLKGNISITNVGSNDATVLMYLLVDRNGNCPPTGRYYDPTRTQPNFYPFSNLILLNSFILRTAKSETITIPTDFILPVKIPLTGCVTLMVQGGELNNGDPVTITSNITFLYDTEPSLNKSISTISFASEICIGRQTGCEKVAPSISTDQAIVRYQRIGSDKLVWSWIGNSNSAASRAGEPSAKCPPGDWNSTSNYYIFKAADCPVTEANPIVYDGPVVDQVPTSAIKLKSLTVNGNQCNGGFGLINRTFNPPLPIKAGDCLVQIQKFNAPQGGVITQETQSIFTVNENATTVTETTTFSDISQNSFKSYIENLSNNGVVNGYSDGLFHPGGYVTRGQMAKFIVKAFEIPLVSNCTNFIDIKETDTFKDYIRTLKCLNIVSGYSDKTYKSEIVVTRGQVTKFVSKALLYKMGGTLSKQNEPFNDVDQTNTYYLYIAYLSNLSTINEKIIGGYSDGTFRSENFIKRDQMSKIVSNGRDYWQEHQN